MTIRVPSQTVSVGALFAHGYAQQGYAQQGYAQQGYAHQVIVALQHKMRQTC
jgi:hypothetical protein